MDFPHCDFMSGRCRGFSPVVMRKILSALEIAVNNLENFITVKIRQI
jgi:hypothetical protein